jgi:hypothetical protein
LLDSIDIKESLKKLHKNSPFKNIGKSNSLESEKENSNTSNYNIGNTSDSENLKTRDSEKVHFTTRKNGSPPLSSKIGANYSPFSSSKSKKPQVIGLQPMKGFEKIDGKGIIVNINESLVNKNMNYKQSTFEMYKESGDYKETSFDELATEYFFLSNSEDNSPLTHDSPNNFVLQKTLQKKNTKSQKRNCNLEEKTTDSDLNSLPFPNLLLNLQNPNELEQYLGSTAQTKLEFGFNLNSPSNEAERENIDMDLDNKWTPKPKRNLLDSMKKERNKNVESAERTHNKRDQGAHPKRIRNQSSNAEEKKDYSDITKLIEDNRELYNDIQMRKENVRYPTAVLSDTAKIRLPEHEPTEEESKTLFSNLIVSSSIEENAEPHFLHSSGMLASKNIWTSSIRGATKKKYSFQEVQKQNPPTSKFQNSKICLEISRKPRKKLTSPSQASNNHAFLKYVPSL